MMLECGCLEYAGLDGGRVCECQMMWEQMDLEWWLILGGEM